MTETTKTVFETYEVRKTKRQKAAFRAYAREIAEREGYDCHEEKSSLGAVNLVVGNPETARVTYTAHYDTCARMPFPNFITPKNIVIYLLYQILLAVVILAVAEIGSTAVEHTLRLAGVAPWNVIMIGYWTYMGLLIVELVLMLAGPANPHTANDNTSGVTAVLDLMAAMPAEMRGDVAFILFDLEEAGMIGSSAYYARHKAAMKGKLLINFDCVSDGDTILFAVRKGARQHIPALQSAFPDEGKFHVEILSKGVFYPSDQMQFPAGVGVAALKKTRRGLLYMNRIHTKKDTAYDEANIAYLVEGAVRLAQTVSPHT